MQIDAIEERKKILKEIIKPAFKATGFRTAGNNFAKNEDGFIKVFSIENSSWNTKDYVSFSLSVGILFPLIEQIRDRAIPKIPSASGCHFEISVNQLNNSQRLFIIDSSTDIDEFREYIVAVVNNHVIPFFNRYSDIQDCTDLYTKYVSYRYDIKPFIGLTLIERGHIAAGNKLMKNIRPNYTESFKKQLRDYRDYLIAKHKRTGK